MIANGQRSVDAFKGWCNRRLGLTDENGNKAATMLMEVRYEATC